MYKFESSQKEEMRALPADSSKAYRKPNAFYGYDEYEVGKASKVYRKINFSS